MESKAPENIPYIVHEADMARQERNIRRLWILCIIMFVALVASNIGWLIYESQFTDEIITQTVEQDSRDGGTNTYSGFMVGGDYGEADNQADGETESP